jgi:hypothetical protein
MSGYATDTETLTLAVALPDGTTVEVTGNNDGVNGYQWSAVHVRGEDREPLTVKLDSERLIDGIRPACGCDDGVLWPMASDCDGSHPYVERCDECAVFDTDEEAADALRERKGGLVVFHLLYDDAERGRWQPALHTN